MAVALPKKVGKAMEQMFQRQDDSTYQVTVSYLEIYNEQVRDLLAELKDYEPSE